MVQNDKNHIAEVSKKDNLISRTDAVDALNLCYANIELNHDRPVNRYEGMFYTAIKMALEHLPSVQPETAKRIVGKSRDGMTLWYQCDMCNEPVDAQDNFCRGCGRRLIDE